MISLTNDEYRLCEHLAAIRQERNEQAGVRDLKMGSGRGSWEIAVEGFVAEFAVAKMLNVWPELDSRPRSGGHDLIAHGLRIDVKAVPERRPKIYIPARKRGNGVDLYVWCLVRENRVEVLGWITPLDLFDERYLCPSPRSDEYHYAVPADLLAPSAREAIERESVRIQ